MSKSSPLTVVVTSGDDIIGTIEPGEFMTYMRGTSAPGGLFLAQYVDRYNTEQAEAGQPERAHVHLKKRS